MYICIYVYFTMNFETIIERRKSDATSASHVYVYASLFLFFISSFFSCCLVVKFFVVVVVHSIQLTANKHRKRHKLLGASALLIDYRRNKEINTELDTYSLSLSLSLHLAFILHYYYYRDDAIIFSYMIMISFFFFFASNQVFIYNIIYRLYIQLSLQRLFVAMCFFFLSLYFLTKVYSL